jgi:hypothetical protein
MNEERISKKVLDMEVEVNSHKEDTEVKIGTTG